MHFIQLNTRCEPEFSDILIAELAELDFDSFEENKQGFSAYVEEEKIDFACAGDTATLETVAAACWLRKYAPDLRVRVVNVVDLMVLLILLLPMLRGLRKHRKLGVEYLNSV